MTARNEGADTGERAAGKMPWYADGLRFACRQCGVCCTGEPGYVWVTEEEIAAILLAAGISRAKFDADYARKTWLRVTLRERKNGDCVFFRAGKGCTVYAARPAQCKTFPFWAENVRSPDAWNERARECPGMNIGRLFTLSEIESIMQGRRGGTGT